MSRPKLAIILFLIVIAVSACGRRLSDEDLNSSSSTSQQPTEEVVSVDSSAESTETTEAESTGEPVVEAVSDDPFAVRTQNASASNGETLFNQMNSTGFSCSSCHNSQTEDRLVGPGLYNIPTNGGERVDGQSAYEYIHNSIVHPNDYIVESYPENLMPQVYADVYSEDEIYDLVAYLVTLGDGPVTVVANTSPPEAPQPAATTAPTNTPEPTITPTPIIISSGLSPQVVLGLARSGIPAYGEDVFNAPMVDGSSCADCHSLDGSENPDGPTLAGIVEIAKTAVGEDVPELYLYNTLTDPDVHGTNLESVYGLNDLYNVIAYLMSQEELETAPADTAEATPSGSEPADATEEPTQESANEETTSDATEESFSEVDDPMLAAIESADPANGETLFNQMTSTGFACMNCHNAQSDVRLIGPGLLGIPTIASEREDGIPAHTYLYEAIANPNAYVVPDYPENLMPQVYSEVFSEEEIYDIIAYLLTLEG